MTTNELNEALNSIDSNIIDRSCDFSKISECFKQKKKRNIKYSVTFFSIFLVVSLFIYSSNSIEKISNITTNNKEFNFNTEYNDPTQNIIDNFTPNEAIEEINASADLTIIYKNDIEKIKDKNLIIVSGKIIKSETYYKDSSYMPMTLSTLAISKIFSNVELPNTINVFEPGALLDESQAKMYLNKNDNFLKKINFKLDGYEYCRVNDEVILFLAKGSSYPDLDEKENFENTYYTAGLIQGKLVNMNGIYLSTTPSSICAETTKYTIEEFESLYNTIK